jgi:hypothetical protein
VRLEGGLVDELRDFVRTQTKGGRARPPLS